LPYLLSANKGRLAELSVTNRQMFERLLKTTSVYIFAGIHMTEPFSFENKEVEWEVDGIPVYGTITRPKNEDTHSVIVFVAGSGPTDGDWCSPLLPGKNGSGKLLAETLASHGFLTLRYDKRASGSHVQENIPKMIGKISMQSHLEELSGAVETLISKEHADEKELFVLTNSEGAIHALNYQLSSLVKFKGMVLTSPPGRSVGQVARSQIYNQLISLPNKETIMKHYDEAIDSFVHGNPIVPDGSLPEGIKQLLLSLAFPANLPFARELWTYDISEVISKAKESLLVVIGKKDVQVDWQADGKALEKSVEKESSVSFVYPENADHVLKYEEKPRDNLTAEIAFRYNAQDRILDPEAKNAIINWFIK
jgi:pimeloyl-ACP methyl ester carboxylesterase